MFLVTIAVAAALGGLARYGLTQAQPVLPLPWVTMLINIIGSGCIGLTYVLLQKLQYPSQIQLTLAFQIGFLGAFTTYSAFSLDVIKGFEAGRFSSTLIYFLLTPLLSVIACYLVYRISVRLIAV